MLRGWAGEGTPFGSVAAWLGDEILVAENPWLAIARQQTSVGAVARRRYGA